MQAGRPPGAGCVCSPRWAARGAGDPAQLGVWLALGLIVVIVGLDMVGGNAELLGLLVSPPIVAASFVGPKRTVAVGLVALAAAIGYGRAVGVDLLAGSQGAYRWSRSGSRPCCRGWWRGSGWKGGAAAGGHPGR